jgi:signal transduction histidine kinase/CheY-like chemotaxis protein
MAALNTAIPESSVEISDLTLSDALNAILAASLRPVCVGMALLYALLTAWYLLQYDGTAQTNMGLSTGLLSLALLVGAVWFERNQLPAPYAHPVAAVVASLVVLHCLFLLVSVPEARHTTNLMIALLGLGCLLLSVRWFAGVAAGSFFGWLWIASGHADEVDWRHFGLALLEAILFGAIVLWVRIGAYRNIQSLRIRDHLLVKELREASEAAMAATRVKSEFLANMSHELRTPMTAVLGMTELRTIERAGNALLQLVNDILDFSKIEAGHLLLEEVGVDLESLVREVSGMLEVKAQQKGLALVLDVQPNMPRLRGDPTRIGQVIINLLGNAIKFTHQGQVKLRARVRPMTETTALAEISVEDSGIGIPKDQIERVFEVFTQADASTTRRYGGTGLGLAISGRLTHLMGGEIRVESELGQGSTFTVSLPLNLALRRSTRPPPSDMERTALFKGRVLLVEDHMDTRSLGAQMLQRMGCEVEVAGDGAQALQRLDQGRFDLVLMDCQMPELNGYETTREIRRRDASQGGHTTVVAFTASVLPEERERCAEVGMDDYLAKPFTKHDLQQVLQRWLEA